MIIYIYVIIYIYIHVYIYIHILYIFCHPQDNRGLNIPPGLRKYCSIFVWDAFFSYKYILYHITLSYTINHITEYYIHHVIAGFKGRDVRSPVIVWSWMTGGTIDCRESGSPKHRWGTHSWVDGPFEPGI